MRHRALLWRGFGVCAGGVFAFGWSHTFVLPYCGLLFRCGCTWLWSGGIAHCNIYDVTSPDCPWCTAPTWAAWIPVWGTPVLMTLGAGLLLARATRWRDVGKALAVSLAIFFGANVVNAYGFKVAMGYPYFLWDGPPTAESAGPLNTSQTDGSIPLTANSPDHHH